MIRAKHYERDKRRHRNVQRDTIMWGFSQFLVRQRKRIEDALSEDIQWRYPYKAFNPYKECDIVSYGCTTHHMGRVRGKAK